MRGAPEPVDTGRLPIGTVTFLLCDVEGSTALWEADPDAMAAAMVRHEAILAEAIARHGGARPREQGEGDNAVAAFCRASDAASAALMVQVELQGEPWPDGITIRVRMGLHTGEAHVVDDTTYAGRDLNRCARIRNLARGGQILLSRTTHDLLVTHPLEEMTFRDIGSHQMKGIERPERVYQMCHPRLEDGSPAFTSRHGVPSNLPACPTGLVGRDADLAELLELGDEARLITITGSGGAGKTRLALALAEASLAASPDGVWWVDLAPLTEPALVVAEVLAALGERVVDHRPLDALVETLAHRSATIVLDNAEHLLDACAELVIAVLTRAPSIRLVVTSREPIGVDGEWSWRIPSLAVPPPDATFEEIVAAPAVQLFDARAQQARAAFRLTEEVAPQVARICRRLDGLPLGIELAAARVRMMSPERIAAGLDDRFRLLTGGGRRALARQQTLQSSVEWSHSLLSEDEQRLFRRLAVFAGAFSIDAAEAVASGDDLDSYAILDLLTRLVDKSLVVADPDTPDARFRLLETMRQFAYDRLVIADEAEELRHAHLAWYVRLGIEAEPHLTGLQQSAWLSGLERDHDNLRAAIDWAVATGDGGSLWSLAGSLPLLWVLHGHFAEATDVYERAGRLDRGVDEADRLRGEWGAALTAFCAGRFRDALATTTDLIERAGHAGDDRHLARGLTLMGALRVGDRETAQGLLRDAAALAAKAGDLWGECDALQKLAGDHVMRDEQRAAASLLELSGPLARTLDSHPLLAIDAALRAHIELRTGNLDEADRWAARAVDEAARCGSLTDAGLAFVVEGEVAIRQGRAGEAIPAIRERLGLCVSAGTNMLVPGLKALLALAEAAAGDPAAGLAVLDDARTPSGGVFGRRSFARAVIELALGHDDRASAILIDQQGDRLASAGDVRSAEIGILLATIAIRRGETREPSRLAHLALEAAVTGPFPMLVADATIVLAQVTELQGEPEEAARLLGGAQAVLAAIGATCTPLTAILGTPDLDVLLEQLGAEGFERAWSEGRALSTDDLVAYVSRSRGPRRRASVGWDSLTPTELRVVDLVADGLTNKAIGEALFITPGTVKTHLAHVYAKLGAANRAEVAAEVARRRS